jgi:trans-AT polyketide synthase/acyltransferase/oxidoreductase domain-containing protein
MPVDLRTALLTLDRAAEVSVAGRVYGLPATPLSAQGDVGFLRAHGCGYAYMAGAMANGIASVELVAALGKAGLIGIYGAAGQAPATVAQAIDTLRARLGSAPFGVNLIHSPSEPEAERQVAELLVQKGVRLVEASAYLALTLPVVRYRVHGIHRDAQGRVVVPNRLIAKVSRVEVASHFLSPPPDKFLVQLVQQGLISEAQRAMAGEIPMADDLTAEADSGGHTDNRPALALVPIMLSLRDRLQAQYRFAVAPRVGAAGGIATPQAVAAAFALGAGYVVTGSVNQACRESGTSDLVRSLLAKTGQADVAMAPAADMFEMGVRVQVLKRGTMFPMRAAKLYDLYSKHRSVDELPASEREILETQFFKARLDDVWEGTKSYFAVRDPSQITRGEGDPRHKLALVCRSYLGQSSNWANQGVKDRQVDYQVWCGPAMGAFNEWVKGTFLEGPEERRVVTLALNLLYGAAVQTRVNILKAQGAPAADLPSGWRPLPLDQLMTLINSGA